MNFYFGILFVIIYDDDDDIISINRTLFHFTKTNSSLCM